MTLSCPSSNCPLCTGEACNACATARRTGGPPALPCRHDHLERHKGIPAMVDHVDMSRVPTKQMEPLLEGAIEVDFADGEACAQFLEALAKAMRAKRRIRFAFG